MSLSKLRELMRGQAATSVQLGIAREAQRPQLNVERKAVVIEAD